MVMRQREAARSSRILETDAPSSLVLSNRRILRSSASSLPNSFFSANHLDFQSLLTASRRPIGFVFWPIDLFVGQYNFHVATAFEDRAGGPARLGDEAFGAPCRAGHGGFDPQPLGLETLVLG